MWRNWQQRISCLATKLPDTKLIYSRWTKFIRKQYRPKNGSVSVLPRPTSLLLLKTRHGEWRYDNNTTHWLCSNSRRSVLISLFILPTAGPRSSVRPSLTRAWWLSATGYVADTEPPPGRGDRQWLGAFPGIAPGLTGPKEPYPTKEKKTGRKSVLGQSGWSQSSGRVRRALSRLLWRAGVPPNERRRSPSRPLDPPLDVSPSKRELRVEPPASRTRGAAGNDESHTRRSLVKDRRDGRARGGWEDKGRAGDGRERRGN